MVKNDAFIFIAIALVIGGFFFFQTQNAEGSDIVDDTFAVTTGGRGHVCGDLFEKGTWSGKLDPDGDRQIEDMSIASCASRRRLTTYECTRTGKSRKRIFVCPVACENKPLTLTLRDTRNSGIYDDVEVNGEAPDEKIGNEFIFRLDAWNKASCIPSLDLDEVVRS